VKKLADDLSVREAAVTTAEKANEAAFAKREAAVAASEARAKELLDKAAKDAVAASMSRTDYESRISKLRALAS
jgi:hypothetical protein